MDNENIRDKGAIREELRELRERIAEDLEVILGAEEVLKGSLYCRKLTCGKAGCKCARGELHVAWFFAYQGDDGRLVQASLNAERLRGCRAAAERYREFREARARVAKGQKRILRLINELEGALLMAPPEQRKVYRAREKDSK